MPRLKRAGLAAWVLPGMLIKHGWKKSYLRPAAAGRSQKLLLVHTYHFLNKGCQAMALKTVEVLKRRFPDKQIKVLVLCEPVADAEYVFDLLGLGLEEKLGLLALCLLGPRLRRWARIPAKTAELHACWRNAAYFFDASGYMLSSHWGWKISLHFLLNLMLAAEYRVPVYCMPQSLGPLDYKPWEKALNFWWRKYLNYPECLFIREPQGVEGLRSYRLSNVTLSADAVLLLPDLDSSPAFSRLPAWRTFRIPRGSAAVIPNIRVYERMTPRAFDAVFGAVIRTLRKQGMRVYLLLHDSHDRPLLERLQGGFKHDPQVIVFAEDLHAVELARVLGQFACVVSSRYHALVHALRKAVPCLAIGWSVKYQELLGLFGLEQYCFSASANLPPRQLAENIRQLTAGLPEARSNIRRILQTLSPETLLSRLPQAPGPHQSDEAGVRPLGPRGLGGRSHPT